MAGGTGRGRGSGCDGGRRLGRGRPAQRHRRLARRLLPVERQRQAHRNGGGQRRRTFRVEQQPQSRRCDRVAERRLEVRDANLVRFSLLSLPLQAQQTYRVLLMIPIGAFIMLLLRNLIGVKTFGTFMPVLVALAFRETQLIAGIALFTLVVGLGLLVRFYLERL